MTIREGNENDKFLCNEITEGWSCAESISISNNLSGLFLQEKCSGRKKKLVATVAVKRTICEFLKRRSTRSPENEPAMELHHVHHRYQVLCRKRHSESASFFNP